MASATPDLQLPSQPQSFTALWAVPKYTAWQVATDAHVCEQLAHVRYMNVEQSGVKTTTC